MRLSILGLHTRGWWLRPPVHFNRIARHTNNGIEWYLRVGPFELTRYASCSCGGQR